MGDSFGPRLAASGYTVIYGSRDPDRDAVRALVEASGPSASAASRRAAAGRADIVILAVPWTAMEDVMDALGDLTGKIVVDLSNPVQPGPDGYMESVVETSAAEVIQGWAPGARVVKLLAPSSYLIDQPDLLGLPATVPIAADDREAKEAVARMVAALGLDPFDAGPLRFARALESLGLVFWVPLQQGRAQGVELHLMRSSWWPCVWDVVATYGPTRDADDLATFPQPRPPTPCEAYRR